MRRATKLLPTPVSPSMSTPTSDAASFGMTVARHLTPGPTEVGGDSPSVGAGGDGRGALPGEFPGDVDAVTTRDDAASTERMAWPMRERGSYEPIGRHAADVAKIRARRRRGRSEASRPAMSLKLQLVVERCSIDP